MDDFAELTLEGASTGVDHFDKVYDPLKEKVKNLPSPSRMLRGGHRDRDHHSDDDDESDHGYDDYRSPRRSQTDRAVAHRRRDSRGGGAYVEESYERRMGRAKSASRDGFGGGRGLDRGGRSKSRRRKYYSDSESSVSPPRRRKSLGEQALKALGIGGGAAAIERDLDKRRDEDRDRSRRRRHRRESDRGYDRGYEIVRRQDRFTYDDPPRRAETFSENTQRQRMPAGYLGANVPERDLRVATRDSNAARSTVSTRDNARGSSKRSSSSSSSSSVCSSSEDERRIKKMKGKEYISAGLAAVATIHAVAGLKSSIEMRDKRHEELMKGEITAEDARRKRNKARLQDVASIGIAALGIKGAYSEWQEVKESRSELAEQKEEREKRHEKRVKKAEKAARKSREERRRGGRYDDRDAYRYEGGGKDGYRSA